MSITFPCYVRVLDGFKAEKKDQMALKKGEFVRVLRADDTDDNYYGEVYGKAGFFPNYYVEVITEEDVPKKDRELFRKLDKAKEAQQLKDKEREDKLREKSPQPRRERALGPGGGEAVSPRGSAVGELGTSPRGSAAPIKSPGALKKPQAQNSMTRSSRRKSSDQLSLKDADMLQIEVNSVVLPSTPLMSPQNRKLSTQPRRLSRVNPKDVKRLYEGAFCYVCVRLFLC